MRGMTETAFQVPILFDYVATFTWAVSGAIVAIRRRFDIVGVFVVALLSAIGGGLLRDGVFLDRVPVFLTNPAYLSLITAATAITAAFTGRLTHIIKAETVQKGVDVIDALGTPAFAVFGMQLAERSRLAARGHPVRRRHQWRGRRNAARCGGARSAGVDAARPVRHAHACWPSARCTCC